MINRHCSVISISFISFFSLITFLVHNTMIDLGNGYYECLLRRSQAQNENSYDTAIKQVYMVISFFEMKWNWRLIWIWHEHCRQNKYFDDPEAGKIESLRRVLYAYRWHNKAVGYCQVGDMLRETSRESLYISGFESVGRNCITLSQRVGIILVSCRMCRTFAAARLLYIVVDVRCRRSKGTRDIYIFEESSKMYFEVLRDLLAEKLPKFANHLKQYDVDVSLFTLSWFLTCFVDTLPHDVYLQIFDVFLYEGSKVRL